MTEVITSNIPTKPKPVETTDDLAGLTIKQRKFIFAYLELGNATRAALLAYYPKFPTDFGYTKLDEKQRRDYYSAANIGMENLKKLENPMHMLLEISGLDANSFLDHLKEGVTAYSNFKIKTKDGKTLDYSGPDWKARAKYAEFWKELLGIGRDAPKSVTNIAAQTVQIISYKDALE